MPNTAEQKNEKEQAYVYAIMKDGSPRRFDKVEDVPQEEVGHVFGSFDEMGKLSMDELDRITGSILKATIPKSKHKQEALDRAWTAVVAVTANVPAPAQPKGRRKKGDRPVRQAKQYTLQYDFDHPGESAEKKFKDLPPQAQTCLHIMAKGGKNEYPEADLKELVAKNSKELETVQEPWRIFQYYRGRLQEEGFLKVA